MDFDFRNVQQVHIELQPDLNVFRLRLQKLIGNFGKFPGFFESFHDFCTFTVIFGKFQFFFFFYFWNFWIVSGIFLNVSVIFF